MNCCNTFIPVPKQQHESVSLPVCPNGQISQRLAAGLRPWKTCRPTNTCRTRDILWDTAALHLFPPDAECSFDSQEDFFKHYKYQCLYVGQVLSARDQAQAQLPHLTLPQLSPRVNSFQTFQGFIPTSPLQGDLAD